jgi:carnitine O-acetyltransferase
LDKLWLDKAYLSYREPSFLNVNWFMMLKDPPYGLTHPLPLQGTYTQHQIRRAATLIAGFLDMHTRINTETLDVEISRDKPLCMHQYKLQFGASRIACPGVDEIVTQWPCTSKHIVVMLRDQMFAVDVLDKHNQRASIGQIIQQLNTVVAMMDKVTLQPAVGLLTTEHRDTWGNLRPRLETHNHVTLDTIDAALFAVCLDDHSAPLDWDSSHLDVFHSKNGRNRWFDKSIQLVVANNGRAGVNGEHSPADALVAGNIFIHGLRVEEASEKEVDSGLLDAPQHLSWSVDSSTLSAIQSAEHHANQLVNRLDSLLLHYNEYGSEFMKRKGFSPDAYVQMAMQLAYYRHKGQSCATYESASTRAFLRGRTETVRVCSSSSLAFTQAAVSKSSDVTSKLQAATADHMAYMQAASSGHGVDRHLLGLRTRIASDQEHAQAAIFQDPAFQKSSYYQLSTSNLSPGMGYFAGFAPVVPDGYGLNYCIGKDGVKFSVSTWTSPTTSAHSFRTCVKNAMDDMVSMVQP